MAQTAARIDPYAGFQFKLDFGDRAGSATFNEISGLEMTVKYDEIREGGQNEFVHRLPSRVEYGNLVLKRGYAHDNELFQWCLSALNRRKIERRDVTVTLIGIGDRRTVFAWTFLGAYPVKWSGPSMRAGDNSVAIESLELAHTGLQIE
jgi:phage tail-like protein